MTKSFLKLAVLIIAAFVSLQHAKLDADVFVTVDPDVQITPNASSRISVTITGLGDDLSLFGYEFRIVPLSVGSSQLSFLEEDASFLSDSDYVFFGNSFAESNGSSPDVGSVSTTVNPGDTFIGADSTANFGDVTLNDTRLLVELHVMHDSGTSAPGSTIGDSFSIDLIPTTGDSVQFAAGNSNTGFLDAALTGVAFNSSSSSVFVVVPEPSSLIVLSMACLPALLRRRN